MPKRRKIRDTQRRAVYRCDAIVRGKRFESLDETKAFVKKVLDSKWVQRKWGISPKHYQRIKIKDGRGTSIARGGRNVLNLPVWSRTQGTVMHELSHMVTHYAFGNAYDYAAHGREFCAVYLALVKHFMGKNYHDNLKEGFKANGVKFSKRKQLSAETLEKLRERGRMLAAARWKDKS